MKALWHWFHSHFAGWGAQGAVLSFPGEWPEATAWKCGTCGHTWIEIK